MQFFLQRLLEDLLQKEITEEERVYLIVHISRTTRSCNVPDFGTGKEKTDGK